MTDTLLKLIFKFLKEPENSNSSSHFVVLLDEITASFSSKFNDLMMQLSSLLKGKPEKLSNDNGNLLL
jgi:hypothetical protein